MREQVATQQSKYITVEDNDKSDDEEEEQDKLMEIMKVHTSCMTLLIDCMRVRMNSTIALEQSLLKK